MEVIMNNVHGGAILSRKAVDALLALPEFSNLDGRGKCDLTYLSTKEFRTNPAIINVVKSLGEEANNSSATNLVIVTIPDNVEWEIYEYEGKETIESPRIIYAK